MGILRVSQADALIAPFKEFKREPDILEPLSECFLVWLRGKQGREEVGSDLSSVLASLYEHKQLFLFPGSVSPAFEQGVGLAQRASSGLTTCGPLNL